MRSYVPDFQLTVARDVNEALEHLSRGSRPFAGGTDLMVLFNAGKLHPIPLVSIRKLPDLRSIVVQKDFIEVGSAVTYSELREHAVICDEFPLLAQAASWTGSIANQNRGTLGGNIANGSPAADSSPVLLVYGAALKLISVNDERWLPYQHFHLGYKESALKSNELIAAIRLPRDQTPLVQYGRKVGTRKAMAISKVSFAAAALRTGFRIAAGSVAPTAVRCLNTEAFLSSQRIIPSVIERAKIMILQDISPIGDIRSTKDYRLAVTQNLLGEFLEMLL